MSSASTPWNVASLARSESAWRDVIPRAVRRTAWHWQPVCDRACSRDAKESAMRQPELVKGVSRDQWAKWLNEQGNCRAFKDF